MTDIKNLRAVDELSAGDLVPVYTNGNGGTRKASAAAFVNAIGQSYVDQAEAQADAATATVSAFQNLVYPGVYAVDPTTRPNGSAMQDGDRAVVLVGGVPTEKLRVLGAWIVPNVDAANLAAPSGSSLVGFLQAGAGASGRTQEDKDREDVSVRDFGAVGNGVTDDTEAVAAAIAYAKANGRKVLFSNGSTYRVTSGFTQSVANEDVILCGETSPRFGGSKGATILLDSVSPTSFFLKMTAGCHLQAENLNFKCNQFVQDRAFFSFEGSPIDFTFENVGFRAVERPLVIKVGAYVQTCQMSNVEFRDSGTIHSESNGTMGTIITLENVHHEGSVPVNTEQIVCNLQGLHKIEAVNFLLEGTIPSAAWTVLKLDNSVRAASWSQDSNMTMNGFWSEWTGTQPALIVDQVSGRVTINDARSGMFTATTRYKLSNGALVEFRGASFSSGGVSVADVFIFEDFRCHARLVDCAIRNAPNPYVPLGITSRNLTIESSSNIRDSAAANERLGTTVFSNTASSLIYKWDGGYFDADPVSITMGGGSTFTPSTDATYGRKMILTPNADALTATFKAKLRGVIQQFDQVWFALRIKLPTFAAGSYQVVLEEDAASAITLAVLPFNLYSGATLDIIQPWRPTAAVASTVNVRVNNSGTSGTAGVGEIYFFAAYLGNSAPRMEYPNYPKNIVTRNSAAPATGTWLQGDWVLNNAPAAAGTPGWVCTAGGTPGTWKAMANIAA